MTDLPPAAQYAALMAMAAGVECQSIDEPIEGEVELIVDALLGIGLKGPVHGVMTAAIHHINASGLPVFSLDIPSGLNADTGCVANFCVKADNTVTFIGLKAGMYTADGPDYCGDIYYCPIQLEACAAKQIPAAHLLSAHRVALPLPERKKIRTRVIMDTF